MALIGMAVYSTAENKRSALTRRTLQSLAETVDWSRHTLWLSDNGSCEETLRLYEQAHDWLPFEVLLNGENLGTARAVNKTWLRRKAGQHAVKMDDDTVIHERGWLDTLEECLEREPKIGIVSLKRGDLEERPDHPEVWFRSELLMLPHVRGQRWLVVERVLHTMGTCQLYSSRLLEKIGYLYQMGGLYALDDCLSAIRCHVAGFYNCFYPHIRIDHIDPGGTPFVQWKQEYAGTMMARYDQTREAYLSGTKNVYQGPFDE